MVWVDIQLRSYVVLDKGHIIFDATPLFWKHTFRILQPATLVLDTSNVWTKAGKVITFFHDPKEGFSKT